MKKKLIKYLSIAILILLSFFIFFNNRCNLTKNDFVFNDSDELERFSKADFYIEIKDGKGNKINIDFNGKDNKFVGKAYLPGEAYLYDCCLSWNSNSEIFIKDGLITYKNGNYKLLSRNSDSIFTLTMNNETYYFMIETFYGSRNVESLFIDIDETKGSINDMNFDKSHETVCFGKASFNDLEYLISIKGRGNTTWGCDKKPYNITFYNDGYSSKKKVEMIDGVKSKKWTLLANYADPTLLRNHIGYKIAKDLDVGLDSKYYDVWMNGEYLGNYLITPKNDYKAPDDGFVLELDNLIDTNEEQFLLTKDTVNIDSLLFTIKENNTDLESADIQAFMQEAWNTVEDFDSENYQNFFDIESWAKYYLLNELYKNYDIISGSIFMHRDGIGEDDKLIAGPVWDLDNTFGETTWNEKNGINISVSLSPEHDYIDSIVPEKNNFCLLQELGKHESFRRAVIEIYDKYSKNFEELGNYSDKVFNLIDDSIFMNTSRWDLNNLTYNNYFLSEESFLKGEKYSVTYRATSSLDDYLYNFNLYLKNRLLYLSDRY